jgi:hypothetical protein
MRRHLLVFCCVFGMAAGAAAQSYTAGLTGANEAPNPGDPDGTGTALITIDGTNVHYQIVTRNIATPSAAHIHRGAPGLGGPVVIGFDVNSLTNGTISGASQAIINEIVANPGNFYVNVHTSAFPGGAVRGPLVPLGGAAPSGPLFIPVVGKVAGAAGTNFVTDVRLVNRGTASQHVMLDYFPQSPTGQTAPTATAMIELAAGEQRAIDDVIGFMNTSGLGAMRVTSDGNVEVFTRVLNDLRSANQGTAGFDVDATPLSGSTTSGTIGSLSNSSTADVNAGIGFRTNIGYFNPIATAVNATFTAHGPTGAVLGTKQLSIPGFSFVQQPVFSLIDSVTGDATVQSNFYVTWSTTSGPLLVYGAVVDNKTGDAVVVQ